MDVWRKDATASGLKDRKVILICEGKAHEFTSQDGKNTQHFQFPAVKQCSAVSFFLFRSQLNFSAVCGLSSEISELTH